MNNKSHPPIFFDMSYKFSHCKSQYHMPAITRTTVKSNNTVYCWLTGDFCSTKEFIEIVW